MTTTTNSRGENNNRKEQNKNFMGNLKNAKSSGVCRWLWIATLDWAIDSLHLQFWRDQTRQYERISCVNLLLTDWRQTTKNSMRINYKIDRLYYDFIIGLQDARTRWTPLYFSPIYRVIQDDENTNVAPTKYTQAITNTVWNWMWRTKTNCFILSLARIRRRERGRDRRIRWRGTDSIIQCSW